MRSWKTRARAFAEWFHRFAKGGIYVWEFGDAIERKIATGTNGSALEKRREDARIAKTSINFGDMSNAYSST